jgi:hypothetical protein
MSSPGKKHDMYTEIEILFLVGLGLEGLGGLVGLWLG